MLKRIVSLILVTSMFLVAFCPVFTQAASNKPVIILKLDDLAPYNITGTGSTSSFLVAYN